jgi:hypothetical protein
MSTWTRASFVVALVATPEMTDHMPRLPSFPLVSSVADAMTFWADGRAMTLYCKANNTYATAHPPGRSTRALTRYGRVTNSALPSKRKKGR